MAWQLIYTSAPRTLTAGQSGYGTVGRSLDVREALIQRLEQLSYYQHGAARTTLPPVVHAYRILNLRGAKYHVLTRCVDAGLDFTNRTNHLAHHLVFAPEELAALPSPALIFQQWNGWRNTWTDDPRFLDAGDWLAFDELPRAAALPANEWARQTGDAARAAALLMRPAADGGYFACEPGREAGWLALLAESLQLLDPDQKSPAQRWQFPFTTCLQEQDQPNDFRWRGCEPGSPVAQRAGSQIFAATDLPIPSGELAELARRGPKKSYATAATSHADAVPAFSGAPAVANAESATARTLRLRGAKDQAAPGPTPRLAPESRETPHRPPNSRRAVPIAAAALLLLFLIIASWRQGWLKQEKASANPTRAPGNRTNEMTPGPAPENVPLVDPFADRVPPDPAPPATQSPVTAARASPEALRELEQKLDGVRTYLVFHTSSEGIPLPRIPELETLLTNTFIRDPRLALGDIQALTTCDRLGFSPAATQPARLSSDYRNLRAKTEVLDFNLDATAWVPDPSQAVRAIVPDIRQCASVLYRPANLVPGGFDPFRLSFVGTIRPEPLSLPKSLLRANRLGPLSESFDPLLQERLSSLVPGEGLHFQLRPCVGTNLVDLYDQIGPEVQPEYEGIALIALRHRLSGALTMRRHKATNLQERIQSLDQDIQRESDADIPLGKVFGQPPDGRLLNLEKFGETHKPRLAINQDTFLKYLAALTKGSSLPEAAREEFQKELKQKTMTEKKSKKLHDLLKNDGRELTNLDTNYFQRRWVELAKVKERADLQNKLNAFEGQIASLESGWQLVPADLSGIPLVRLWVVDAKGTRRLELIRFTDSKAP